MERASRGAATATTTEKALLRYSKYFEVVENLRECLRKIVEKVKRNVGFALLCKKSPKRFLYRLGVYFIKGLHHSMTLLNLNT